MDITPEDYRSVICTNDKCDTNGEPFNLVYGETDCPCCGEVDINTECGNGHHYQDAKAEEDQFARKL